jgi:hypothetical protein
MNTSIYLSYDAADAPAVAPLKIALEAAGATLLECQPDRIGVADRVVVCFSKSDHAGIRFDVQELRAACEWQRSAAPRHRPVIAVKLNPCDLSVVTAAVDVEVLELPLRWSEVVRRVIDAAPAGESSVTSTLHAANLTVDGNLDDVAAEGVLNVPGGTHVRTERTFNDIAVAGDVSFAGYRGDGGKH